MSLRLEYMHGKYMHVLKDILCLDGAVRLALTIDLEGYTGGSLLLVGSPKPGRPKGKCQTKRNTTTSRDRLLPSWCSDLYDQQKLLTTSSNDVVDTDSPSCYRFFEGQQFNGSCLTSSDN
ncbi:hypothetical protein TNCV_2369281 [Trichonephila clavipes]|nr:hypothetical protein TNCV_2369281 [Trichonephila clavipes]